MGKPTPSDVDLQSANRGVVSSRLNFLSTFSELWKESGSHVYDAEEASDHVSCGSSQNDHRVKQKIAATAAYQIYRRSSGPMLDRLADPQVSEMLAQLADRQTDYSTAALLRTIPDFVGCRYSLFQISDAQHDIAAEFFETPTPYGLILDDPTLAISSEIRLHLQQLVKTEKWGYAFTELVDTLANPANPRSVIMRLIGRLVSITMV